MTKIYCLTFMEARSLRIKVSAGLLPSVGCETVPWLQRRIWWFAGIFWHSLPCRNIIHIFAFFFTLCSPYVCAHVQIYPFYKDISNIRVYINHILKFFSVFYDSLTFWGIANPGETAPFGASRFL